MYMNRTQLHGIILFSLLFIILCIIFIVIIFSKTRVPPRTSTFHDVCVCVCVCLHANHECFLDIMRYRFNQARRKKYILNATATTRARGPIARVRIIRNYIIYYYTRRVCTRHVLQLHYAT